MTTPSATPATPSRWERFATLATWALALAWLTRLVPQALAARLQTDECFHALVAREVGTHGWMPASLPGLYGGYPYFYPPLFHLAGGLAYALGGADGFLLTNVAVAALVLFAVALGVRRLAAPAAARWAVAVCIATEFLSVHAVRLYAEALSTLLVAVAALALAGLLRRPRRGVALLLGFATGLAILAKYSALVLPPAYALLALGALATGRRPAAGALALATLVSALVAAPWLLRMQHTMGSPIYPAMGHDVHPLLMRLNVAKYTPPPTGLWLEMARRAGPAVALAAVAALALGALRRRAGVELGLVCACVLLVLLAPLQAMLAPRHLLPLVVAAGALACVALDRASAGMSRARRVADLAALALAAWAVATLPPLRAREDLDEPREMDAAFAAVRAHVPVGGTVLARETYDVLWYTGRAANWPVPFGQKDPPVGAFLTSDPDSIARDLARHGIGWVLLTDDDGPPRFDGGDWPRTILRGLDTLVARGRATEAWRDGDHALMRLAP